MLVDPERLFLERDELGGQCGQADLWDRITIDRDAPLVTAFHRAANKVREVARGQERHGSCGAGIWEAQKDARNGFGLTLGMVREMSARRLRRWLRDCQARKRDELDGVLRKLGPAHYLVQDLYRPDLADQLAETYSILSRLVPLTRGLPDVECAVFEGSQGLLLDEFYGWRPWVTGSTTTSKWARDALYELGGEHEITHIGCTRAYSTRHGAGPFVTHDSSINFPEPHNIYGLWQGEWRQGYTDFITLDYAVRCDPSIDCLAVSHMDYVGRVDDWNVCIGYTMQDGTPSVPGAVPIVPFDLSGTEMLSRWMRVAQPVLRPLKGVDVPGLIAEATGLPVAYVGTGPTHVDRNPVNITPSEIAA
jgi:adenylosuccinate synthase